MIRLDTRRLVLLVLDDWIILLVVDYNFKINDATTSIYYYCYDHRFHCCVDTILCFTVDLVQQQIKSSSSPFSGLFGI